MQNQKSFFVNQKLTYSNPSLPNESPSINKKPEFQFQNYQTYTAIKSPYPQSKNTQKQIPNFNSNLAFNNQINNSTHNTQSTPYLNMNQNNMYMSKSYMKKEITPGETQMMIRDLRQKIFKINKILHDHQQQISQIKQVRLSNNTTNSLVNSMNSTLSESISQDTKNSDIQVKEDIKYLIQKQIEKIRSQVLQQFVRKEDFQYRINMNFNQLDSKILDKINSNEHVADIRMKILDVRKQFEATINNIHDANRMILGKIQKDMIQFRQILESYRPQIISLKAAIDEKQKPSFLASNRVFYNPKILKYKQTIQLVNGKQGRQQGSAIILNEIIYYVDKQGCLLDKNYHYLVDKNNKNIQLDERQVGILRYHNLLQ